MQADPQPKSRRKVLSIVEEMSRRERTTSMIPWPGPTFSTITAASALPCALSCHEVLSKFNSKLWSLTVALQTLITKGHEVRSRGTTPTFSGRQKISELTLGSAAHICDETQRTHYDPLLWSTFDLSQKSPDMWLTVFRYLIYYCTMLQVCTLSGDDSAPACNHSTRPAGQFPR